MTNDFLLQSTINAVSGHEFRTPMNAIFGFANLLHDSAGSISAEEQKSFSKYILNSARHLMNHSERLNRWYYFKNSIATAEKAEGISSDSLINLIKKTADKHQVDGDGFLLSSNNFEIRIPAKKDTFFTSLEELVDNAFKFSAKGTIPAFSALATSNKLVITIQNYSDKASSYDLRNYTAFTQFEREKHEQQGLGLGMEIAQLGISKCGGTLKIAESKKENGHDKIQIEVCVPLVYCQN